MQGALWWYEHTNNTLAVLDCASAEYDAARVVSDHFYDEYKASLGRLLALPASPQKLIEVAGNAGADEISIGENNEFLVS